MKRNRRAYLKYIASLLLFGSNGIVAAHIALPSAEIVFWRTLAGSLLLLLLLAAGHGRRPSPHSRRDLLFVFLSGISMGLSWIFLYEAYARIGVSLSSLAYYCAPVFVLLVSPLVFQERLTVRSVADITAVFTGVLLTNSAVSGSLDRFGLLCGGMSAAAHACMVIFSKKAQHMQGMENAAVQLVMSFLTVALYLGVRTGFALHAVGDCWPWLLMLGLVNTGFGCYLYFSSLGHLSVASVSLLGYLEPLSAVLLAVPLLGERLNALQWLGAVLIVGGALFSETGSIGRALSDDGRGD